MRSIMSLFIVLVVFTASPAFAGLDEGLVVYLTFDSVKGDRIFDVSGNELHAQQARTTRFVLGKYGDAIRSAAATEECVTIPASDALNISGEITMGAWVFRENWSEGSAFWLDKGSYAGNPELHAYSMAVFQVKDADWELGDLKGTVILMSLGGAGNQNRFSAVLRNKGDKEWHHLAGTYDGAFVKMYMDGELFFDGEDFGPTEVVADTNNRDLRIGCVENRPQFAFHTGAIDEVALWNRSLTEAEIRTAMKGNILTVSPGDKASTTWGDIKRRTGAYETP